MLDVIKELISIDMGLQKQEHNQWRRKFTKSTLIKIDSFRINSYRRHAQHKQSTVSTFLPDFLWKKRKNNISIPSSIDSLNFTHNAEIGIRQEGKLNNNGTCPDCLFAISVTLLILVHLAGAWKWNRLEFPRSKEKCWRYERIGEKEERGEKGGVIEKHENI